ERRLPARRNGLAREDLSHALCTVLPHLRCSVLMLEQVDDGRRELLDVSVTYEISVGLVADEVRGAVVDVVGDDGRACRERLSDGKPETLRASCCHGQGAGGHEIDTVVEPSKEGHRVLDAELVGELLEILSRCSVASDLKVRRGHRR